MRRLILNSFLSPGDILMLTAAVRDLHAAYPGQFQTDVRTTAETIWEHNPLLTPLNERQPGVELINMHYPLIQKSNQRPYHFIHGYVQFLETSLKLQIPLTQFKGDVYLSAEETSLPVPGANFGVPERFWIIVCGGKYDFTAKWWNPGSSQAIVDHFAGRLTFVQCGEAGHWHPPLSNVVNLVGQTSLREFIRLMYHAEGVVCPVTFAMHLAAAVETKPGRPRSRACVVVGGGREPAHWEAYPTHQYISTIGSLPCCETGGCWKSRCQTVGDCDPKDHRDLCERPVQLTPELRIPQCLDMIRPQDVIERIEIYLNHWARDGHRGNGYARPEATRPTQPSANPLLLISTGPSVVTENNVLIEFRHGLGDAVQLTSLLKHLAVCRPEWKIDVAALRGKHSAFTGLCRKVYVLDKEPVDRTRYQRIFRLDWHESRRNSAEWPNTKLTRCLQEVFSLIPQPELCTYEIQIGAAMRERARRYLQQISPAAPDETGRFPVVLIHYEGNTSGDRKNLPHELIHEVCETLLRLGYAPAILDWDGRSPLPDHVRIHNPSAEHELWGGQGTGDAETLAALIESSALLIGIDSGPLHVAGATKTPTIGVWTKHHPIHFFDVAPNVLHLVPKDHEKLAAGSAALEAFRRFYRSYPYEQLGEIPAVVEARLSGTSCNELTAGLADGSLSQSEGIRQ